MKRVDKPMEAWDEMWTEPSTKLESFAPLIALGLAALIAWIG